MTVDTNSTPLEQPLKVRSGLLAADLRTIGEAAKFIGSLPASFGDRLHWLLAGAVLKAADANPGNADLLGTATLAIKNALETDRMLAPEFDFGSLISEWKAERAKLAVQLELLESGKMRTGTNVLDATTQQDIARLHSWIADLDGLVAEHSR
jgi:hypothetical protein